jgi:hypothetical protein
MTPIANTSPYITGAHKLPAGAIPLCTDKPGSVICQTPHGYWIRWWEGTRSIETVPRSIQRKVVTALVTKAGGTEAFADLVKVSPRTVEAWRSCRIPLPLKAADDIANLALATG